LVLLPKSGNFQGSSIPNPRSLSIYGHQHGVYNSPYIVEDRATLKSDPISTIVPLAWGRYLSWIPPVISMSAAQSVLKKDFRVWGRAPESFFLPLFWSRTTQVLFYFYSPKSYKILQIIFWAVEKETHYHFKH
jgi:hypothetical protein